MTKQKICLLFSCLIFFSSCNRFSSFKIEEIILFKNLNSSKNLNVDLENVLSSGIIIPTKAQTNSGYFRFSFKVNNPKYSKYFYKIYYQNTSYQYPISDSVGNYNNLASENFYGSWEETDIGFKAIDIYDKDIDYLVTDSFRIIGNPRNEKIYFGNDFQKSKITDFDVQEMINYINTDSKWVSSIKEKAIKNKRSVIEQQYLDAKWAINTRINSGNCNNRWKRNPRMGNYEFLIVITNPVSFCEIPYYVKNISILQNDSTYLNPFYYFLKGNGKNLKETYVYHEENGLKVKSILTPKNGVYANTNERTNNIDKSNFCIECSDNINSYNHALFEENYHPTIANHKISSIPLTKDVNQNEYTINDYLAAEKKYDSTSFKFQTIHYGNAPCEMVKVEKNYIKLINKGSQNVSNAEKRNVGIKTRIGFTYGKITAKVKFPSLINSSNVWNGLTNAIWLLNQDKDQWNYRRKSKTGYTEKGQYKADAIRIPQTSYSEIDFEILKASKQWPKDYYKSQPPNYINEQNSDNVVIALTNWDLCNKDPKEYFYGVGKIKNKFSTYEGLRWTDYYQALTIKHEEKNSELFNGEFYFYQIEWKPGEIIWRIGPDKNKLKEIGYMNDNYSSIPNNQMVLLVTQEYHQSSWWPPIPFKQEFIPYPKNDIIGKVFSVEVE